MGVFDWLFKKSEPKTGGGSAWKVGDRVLAKWMDAFFYPGRIRAVEGSRFQVSFDYGDVAWVHQAHILSPDIKVGSQVFCRIQGGPSYFPGTVSQQKGETIEVRYEHGDQEWTSLSMVRVQRPIADVAPEELPAGTPAPAKQNVDLGAPADLGDWRTGDRVLARWLDFFWYPGTILGMGAKGAHILYDDGDQRLVQENHLMPLTVEEGEQIFIRPKNEPQRVYSNATVVQVDGERIDVEFEEDGRRETNTKVSRARFWRCPVGVKSFPFEEGDRVLAYDSDECVYPAEIVSIQDDRVIVQYLDGPERMLTPELIKRFDLRVGAKIECRWKGGPNYFPGVLSKLEGERIHVNYDDGDQEWTSVRLVRLPKPPV
ncbi:MAG: hypothetical protein L0Y72_27780 [Gemmataceae bacterium]|nr:hypothetical protein [Gemmataceae bacterium]MCI0742847.1 hypothetical protein [Gemmataceae bacterium]